MLAKLTVIDRPQPLPQPARSRRRSGRKAKVTNSHPTLSDHPDLTSYFRASVKDKANHAVVLDKSTSDKLYKDVQSYRLITVATLVDRLKINGSLARAALKDLEEKGQIKKVVGHSKLTVYSECSASGPLPKRHHDG